MINDRILYLECRSGISGDMTVAALLDLGADEKILREALASLPLEGYQIRISRVKKSGLDACDFAVLLDKSADRACYQGRSYDEGQTLKGRRNKCRRGYNDNRHR